MLKQMLAAGALALTAFAPAQAADYEFRFQSFWQGGTINQQAFEEFASEVGELSDGRIEIEALPADAIVPSTETLNAAAAGILHGIHSGGALHIGNDPAFALVNDVPAGYDEPAQFLSWFTEGGGLELARELYAEHGVHYIGPVMWGAESIPVKRKVETVADFEGVTMRSPEGIAAQMWRKIGVGVSTLPGSEVYTALETGRIEATDWGSIGMNDQLGYDRIAEYAIFPGIHSMPAGDVAMNQDVWDELPDDLKAVFEEAVASLNKRMLEANEMLDAEYVAKRDPETLLEWSDEERAKLREVAREAWEEWSTKSPMATKIYESHIAHMQSLGLL